MGNPNAIPPKPFVKGDPRANRGGRTPSKWLHELLSAANDTSAEGKTRREAIGMHLLSIATSWEVKTKGAGESAIQVADAKNAIEAAKLLLGYDMGKPAESVDLTSSDGSMSPVPAASSLTSAEQRQALSAILTKATTVVELSPPETPESEDDGPVTSQ